MYNSHICIAYIRAPSGKLVGNVSIDVLGFLYLFLIIINWKCMMSLALPLCWPY